VESEHESSEARVQALGLLARLRPDVAADLIPGLLDPRQPPMIQAAAARSLADVGSPVLTSRILGGWPRFEIAARREVLAAVLGVSSLAPSLLDALEAGSINPVELDPISRSTLERHPDVGLRNRAAALLAKSAPSDRRAALEAYRAALTLPGDARRGADVFAKNCQSCHQRQGIGRRVGPDLSGIAARPAAALLGDILDPNRDVSPDSMSYSLLTARGQVLTGLLAEETSTSLRLRRAEGVEEVILRSEVDEFRSTGRSLMPEGLEQTISVQGMADLLAYLRRP
jgi:putative heme-binding domain-containing protein